MSIRGAILSALHLFTLLAFFSCGLFFLLLPYLPLTRELIIDFLTHRYTECSQIGLGIVLISLIFLFGFYGYSRGKFLVIQMGVSTDLKVIRQEIETCFSKQFSKKISLKTLEIGPKSILDLKVHLSPLDEEAREKLFVDVEKQLTLLLHERFGYSKSFRLIVNI